MTEEPLCARCARHMKTCCQTREAYASPGDRERISAYTGRDDFHELRAPTDPDYLDQDDDPVWAQSVFRPDGARRVLRRKENGDCTFLGEAGCTLPLDVRPLVCRLYPFDFDASGLKQELAEGCPTELLRPGQGLLQVLSMDAEEASRWRAQLYEEIRREPHAPA